MIRDYTQTILGYSTIHLFCGHWPTQYPHLNFSLVYIHTFFVESRLSLFTFFLISWLHHDGHLRKQGINCLFFVLLGTWQGVERRLLIILISLLIPFLLSLFWPVCQDWSRRVNAMLDENTVARRLRRNGIFSISLFVLTPGDLRSSCQINQFIDQRETTHPFLDGNRELPKVESSASFALVVSGKTRVRHQQVIMPTFHQNIR